MFEDSEIRLGERTVEWPGAKDASLIYIGQIETPWRSRADCPRQGDEDGPLCRVTLFEPWAAALDGVDRYSRLEMIYWLHRARRDLVLQCARRDVRPRGTFALRSPARPNPIGTAIVKLVSVEGATLVVQGLDCLSGTPLLDFKPCRLEHRRG